MDHLIVTLLIISMLILTTLPHLLAVYWAPTQYYAGIIVTSTLASAVWHVNHGYTTGVIDHLIACVWGATDLWLSYETKYFYTIVSCNGFIVISNNLVTFLDRNNIVSYEICHSVWHIISSIKAIYVAYLLSELLM